MQRNLNLSTKNYRLFDPPRQFSVGSDANENILACAYPTTNDLNFVEPYQLTSSIVVQGAFLSTLSLRIWLASANPSQPHKS